MKEESKDISYDWDCLNIEKVKKSTINKDTLYVWIIMNINDVKKYIVYKKYLKKNDNIFKTCI